MNRLPSFVAIAGVLSVLNLAAVCAQSAEANPALAASAPASAPVKTPCDALAADKKLTGAARAAFLKKCDDDAGNELRTACDAKADEQKLGSTERRDYLKRCMAAGRQL